jgi:hypothetical protein
MGSRPLDTRTAARERKVSRLSQSIFVDFTWQEGYRSQMPPGEELMTEQEVVEPGRETEADHPAPAVALRRSRSPLLLGLAPGIAAIATYASAGYSHLVLLLWLGGLITLALYFGTRSTDMPRIARLDFLVAGGLTAAFIPLYAIGLYSWPVQVGSDEVAIMTYAERHAQEQGVDLLGLSTYLGHPKLLFVFIGKLGGLLGGVDLGNMRLVHGIFGLLTIAVSYALFRQLLSRGWAAFAVCVLGLNHSLFMLSRMAMRENTVVLVAVTALALLLWGLRHDNRLFTFLGGVAAGLGFYVYFPARAVFLLWLLFLAGLALWYRRSVPIRRVATLGAIAATGAVLTAGPVIVAGLQAPPEINEQQRLALLVYPESREIQKTWVFADTETEGIRKNIVYGLTAFNSNKSDNAWNYPNLDHGFVDPLTGILLWIGVGVLVVRLLRRREEPWALLPLGSFLAMWLGLAFLINKAPNYPRMLITLPFVAYLVTVAVRAIVQPLRARLAQRDQAWGARAVGGLAAVTVAAIAVWNLAIAWDFVSLGQRTGDDIGGTGRYITSHSHVEGVHFYLSASEDIYPYYVWGMPHMWHERMVIFTDDDQQIGDLVDPNGLANFSPQGPFVLFMNRDLYSLYAAELARKYPQATVRNITSDGRLVAFDASAT